MAFLYLLELELGPLLLRLATRSADVPSAAGDLPFLGGMLGIEWTQEWRIGVDTASSDVPIQLLPGTLDVADLIRQGYDLASAFATLSRIADGQSYEDRRVLHRGLVSEPVYETRADPVSFSLRRLPTPGRLHPGLLTVIAMHGLSAAFPQSDVFPEVFGSPGSFPDAVASNRNPGSPGVRINVSVVVIAGHRVEAATVDVTESGTRAYTSYPVMWNGLYSYVELNGTHPDYFVRWTDGPACLRVDGLSAVRTAGELIELMLFRAGVLDVGRTARAVPLLPQPVSGYYDTRIEPLEWLRSNILPLLPCGLVSGPGGLYPVVWRHDAEPADAAFSLSAERSDIYRVSPVTYESTGQVVNAITLAWNLDAERRTHGEILLYAGVEDPELDPLGFGLVHLSEDARHSHQRFGPRPLEIETDHIYSGEGAHSVCRWMLRRYAHPLRYVEYALRDATLPIEVGDPVFVEDNEVAIAQVCTVERYEDRENGVVVIGVRLHR